MTVKRWCRECGHYVPLTKYTRPTTKGTQQRCDDCLAPKDLAECPRRQRRRYHWINDDTNKQNEVL